MYSVIITIRVLEWDFFTQNVVKSKCNRISTFKQTIVESIKREELDIVYMRYYCKTIAIFFK